MSFVYVHPADLDAARELRPDLFDETHVVEVDKEVPRGRVITSESRIYSTNTTA